MTNVRQKPLAWIPGINRSHPLAKGLVGCWPFWEGGGGTLFDISGRGNHGTLTNMDPATDWVATEKGWALDFDGSDDYVQAPSIAAITPGVEYTIVVLFRLIEDDANDHPLLTQVGGSSDRMQFMIAKSAGAGSYCNFGHYNGASYNGASANALIAADTWHHVVVVQYTDDSHLMYLNGIAQSGTSAGGNPGSTAIALRIGSNHYGSIAQASVYDRALPASEIAEHHDDPWCICRPRSIRVFMGQTTGAPAAGDGPLIGGKLIGGGKLMRGRLVA